MSKIIKQENTQKISLNNLVGDKEIQQTLVYCALMVGQKPDKYEIEILTKWLKRQRYNLTLEELILAFELNCTNKHWNIIKPYGSFNSLYVGEILSNYDIYKAKKIRRETLAIPEKPKQLITHEEAKPLLDKMSLFLKKMDLKHKLKNNS
jgi:hypothetical protein